MIETYLCSICSTQTHLWHKKDGYSIFQCPKCGHGQVRPIVSSEKIREIYQISGHDSETIKHQDINLHSIWSQEKEYPNSIVDAERFVKNTLKLRSGNSDKSLLDVGAGYGFFSKYFSDAWFEVDAIENAKLERKIFYELNGFAPFDGLFEDFVSPKKYSHILMSQVLEHVREPELWMQKSYEILNPNGLFIIALPNFGSIFRKIMQNKEPFIIPPYHLNYFTIASLSQLLSKNGFEVVKTETKSRIPFHKILKKYKVPFIIRLIISALGSSILTIIDLANYGSMINIYAKKVD